MISQISLSPKKSPLDKDRTFIFLFLKNYGHMEWRSIMEVSANLSSVSGTRLNMGIWLLLTQLVRTNNSQYLFEIFTCILKPPRPCYIFLLEFN